MTSENIRNRKLAAIVFTDISGFTKLSSENEEAAYEIIEKQREIVKPIVEEFGGTWLKEMGDGLLLSFPSSKLAVKSAIKIQQQTKDIDGLNLRIGIHQGDILFSGSDVFGDDVNIASRIEPFSAVGGIAISNKVKDDLSGSPEIVVKFVSQPNFKGVKQEIKVYCITSHGLPETDLTKVTAKLEHDVNKLGKNQKYIISAVVFLFLTIITLFLYPKINKELPSLTILLMENIGNAEDQFWTRGITEDLILKIASTSKIKVSSIRDVLKIDSTFTLDEIASKLNVQYLLTSSLHKRENQFELKYQLIDMSNGVSKFANKKIIHFKDAPYIVGNLASEILTAFNLESSNEIDKPQTTNISAYEFYLKGKYLFHKRENIEDLEVARGLLLKAIEFDNNLLVARDQLGYTYFVMSENDKAFEIYNETYEKAKKAGDLAIQASMLCNFGNIEYGNGNFDAALKYYLESSYILENITYGKLNYAVVANIGLIYHEKLNYNKAREYYNKAINMAEIADDKKSIGMNLINLSALESDIGNSEQCIQMCYKANSIFEEVEDKYLQSYILHTIGYNMLINKNFSESENYYRKALDIRNKLGDEADIANTIAGLGLMYLVKYDFKNSFIFLDSALSIQKRNDIRIGIATTSLSFGDLFYEKGNLNEAMNYYSNALIIAEAEDLTEDKILAYQKIGAIHFSQNNFLNAEENLLNSIKLQKKNEYFQYNPLVYAYSLSYLILTKKELNLSYNLDELNKLTKSIRKNLSAELSYRLYQIFGDKEYLNTAYNEIIKNSKISVDSEEYLSLALVNEIYQEWKNLN